MTGFFDSKQMDSKEAGWVGVHSQMYFIFFCYAVRFGSCVKNTIPAPPLPPKKLNTLLQSIHIYDKATQIVWGNHLVA